MPARLLSAKHYLLGAVLLLQGCAFQQWQIGSITQQLQTGSPQQALSAMEKLNPPTRDQVQYLLNLGMLKHLNGDIDGSIEDLQAAAVLIKQLKAISVREALGATAINETLRSFSGSPTEQILAQQLLALNYLAKGDLDGARVEILQADVIMREPTYEDKINGQLASARYLGGIVYEMGGEWDSALISYRKAFELMIERGQGIPTALENSLLRMTRQVGLRDEYQQYTQRFNRQAVVPKAEEAEVIAIYWQGLVSQKKQSKISIYAPPLRHFISIAVPSHRKNYQPAHASLLSVGQYQNSTQLIENVEALVREDLDAQMPKIIATTLARVVVKHQAVKEAKKEDDRNNQNGLAFLSIITDIAVNLSEIADIRSWNTLPSNIQIARLIVPAGDYPITLGTGFKTGTESTPATSQINLKAGQKVFILGHSLGTQLFVYQNR